jgi:hypothetical protein
MGHTVEEFETFRDAEINGLELYTIAVPTVVGFMAHKQLRRDMEHASKDIKRKGRWD